LSAFHCIKPLKYALILSVSFSTVNNTILLLYSSGVKNAISGDVVVVGSTVFNLSFPAQLKNLVSVISDGL
jgi:FMN-dependent NADH-azoreductase